LSFALPAAKYTDFAAAPGFAGAVASCDNVDAAGNCQLAGNELPQAPEWTVAASFEHTWDLGDAKLTGRIDGKYVSKQFFGAFNYESMAQDDYGLIDANLDYARDNWKVSLWGRNLTDETYLAHAEEYYLTSTYNYAWAPPLMYGIRFEIWTP
jgi:iron complex outermembrane receptor protein